jgi:hypothetical protein
MRTSIVSKTEINTITLVRTTIMRPLKFSSKSQKSPPGEPRL